MKTVTVVIPAYNEEDTIKDTLLAVKKIEGINRILVVDDGSSDRTADIAREQGVEVLKMSSNRGKGGAMNAAAAIVNTDIVVFLDADLGETASQAELLIDPVIREDADLCIAAFPPPRKKGGFGLVKNTARWAIRKMGNIEVVSPLSGQRAMSREVLAAVTPFNEAYGVELGMTLTALSQGFCVREIMTTMKHNESGRDLKGFIHRGKQFIDVIKVIKLKTGRQGI